MKLTSLALFILTSFCSCQTDEDIESVHPFDKVIKVKKSKVNKTINLYELSWIQGLWIDSTSFPGNVVVENWTLENDTLSGRRGTIKGNDTTYSQTSKIFINDDKPVYLLEPEGSSFVSFKTKEYSKNSITFGNSVNLAPTQLTYSKVKEGLGLEFIIITQVGERKFKHLFKAVK